MRVGTSLVVLYCLVQPVAAQERREMGAHQHGHGTLNIAIEGTRLTMELEVPGNDIVGFEHVAKTKAQLTSVAKAKTQLGTPRSLFRFPEAAGCSVKQADVKIAGGKEKADAKKGSSKHADHDHDHSEFHAEYALECTTINNLTSIEFPYFATFKGAQELDVSIITPKGQSKFEVKSSKPRLDLSGVM
jgi:hypothetical protein